MLFRSTYKDLLEGNQRWAQRAREANPELFARLAKGQAPKVVWIGCADSRVPATQLCDCGPGDIFVHRNIANTVVASDLNLHSVLEYAVAVLKVKHIVVCGHSGCGGVAAALGNQRLGTINQWICHIKDVYHTHFDEIDAIKDPNEKLNRMIERHVEAQVHNVAKIGIVQDAWRNGQELQIHGCVYDPADGLLRDLLQLDAGHRTHPVYDLVPAKA